jgi:DNA polymerase-3 subunit epsilon
MKQLFIDIETTSLEIYKARICQIGLIYGDINKTILINPGISIPPETSKIHGIYDHIVKDAPTFQSVSNTLLNIINNSSSIIGYNIRKYDWPILYMEFLRCGIELPHIPLIDVYELVDSYEPNKKLNSVYLRYFGENIKGAHDAGNDILATKKIYEYILKKLS